MKIYQLINCLFKNSLIIKISGYIEILHTSNFFRNAKSFNRLRQ